MFAAILCLLVLLMLTSTGLAQPLRRATAARACPLGQQSMPDLNKFLMGGSPGVMAIGRLIKGLYYSDQLGGPHTQAAFYMACDRLLEPKPFLVVDFQSNRFAFDGDRDGCAEASGALMGSEIDPAGFSAAIEGYEKLCDEEVISQRQLNGLNAVQ